MTLPVGADIESICSKCGDVWHVVVAKVKDKVVKVLCKQCGAQHRYKPPIKAGTPVAATRPRGPGAPKRAVRGSKPAAEPEPPEVDLSRPIQPYHMTTCFQVGDRIQHSSFGMGVVDDLPAPGKIQVFFPDGRKLLVHDRKPVSDQS